MKRIFTLMFVFVVAFSFAQRAHVSLESGSETTTMQAKDGHENVILPGSWEDVVGVGTYRWVDADNNPIGWIFGNNTYGDQAVGQKFDIDGTIELEGAYFWVGAAAEDAEEVHFNVHAWNDGPGDWLGGKSVPLNEVLVYVTEEGVGPGDFMNAFYVEFDAPIQVTDEFFMAVGFGGLPWAEHGDGLAMVTSLAGQGGDLNYAFIQDSDGEWNASQTVNGALVMDLAIFPVIHDENGDEGYTVTFNVDMTDAEDFDPAEHSVWVTGNFAGWATPQQEGSIEMTMVAPAKEDEVILFEEDFQDWIPEGWSVESTSETTWEQIESITIGEGDDAITVVPVVGDFFAMNSWTDEGVDQDEKLITAAFDLTGYDYAELNFQFFGHYHWSVDPNDNCDLFVRVSTDGTTWVELWNEADHPDFTSTAANYTWLPTVIDLSEYVGNDAVYVKFVYEGFDGAQFGIDEVNVVAGSSAPVEEIWYTATVENIVLAEDQNDTLQYKYFSTHVAEGWDGGEWEGDPNREVELTADIELFDIWGEQPPVSVVENELAEQGISLFPNPVSTQLTVRNSEVINSLRIFDLTGRMVYSQAADNHTVVINVGELKQGVYVMQVMTANGVSAQKFNVVK